MIQIWALELVLKTGDRFTETYRANTVAAAIMCAKYKYGNNLHSIDRIAFNA